VHAIDKVDEVVSQGFMTNTNATRENSAELTLMKHI
jgi:hypothetical protein